MRSFTFGRSTYVLSTLCVIILSVAAPTLASAADTPVPASSPGMTLPNVIQLAIRSNPTLVGQQYAIAEAVARTEQANLRPPITIGADVENVLGTRAVGAFSSVETTLRLGTVIELGSKRALRVNAANMTVTSVSLQRDIQALDLLSIVTSRFINNLAAQSKVSISTEHVERARQIVESVRTRVNAGVGSPLEEGNATVHLREMEIELGLAEVDLRRSWALLAATWGAPPDGTGRAAGDLNVLPALPEFANFVEKIERNPYVARFAAERAAAEAQARLARANRSPDITVNAGVRRLEAMNDQALVMGFSMPLNSANRNAAVERAADARVSQATYGEMAAKIDNLATIYGLYEQARQARVTFTTLREQSLPVAEQTLARAENGFRAGRFSLFEVSTAQEQFQSTKLAIVEAAETYHLAIAEIERLTNEPIEIQTDVAQGAKP